MLSDHRSNLNFEVTVNNIGHGAGITKISICDPQNERCAKVNAGRRLETTN